MKNNKIFLIILLLAGVLILFGHFYLHGGNILTNHHIKSNNASEKSNEKIAPNTVEIKNYAFTPGTLKVKKGTTVTWVNQDLAPHTVTMDDEGKEGPKSKVFGKGEKYTYTFTKTGTFPYHCEPHPYMKAIVEVTE